MEKTDERTIWSSRQNHPELVVVDAKKEFNLSETDCDKLRFILLNRGVNKWLYARRLFIKLKHEVKKIRKSSIEKYGNRNELVKEIKKIQERMQNIARLPRWIVWGKILHKNMKNNINDINIKGNHC